MQYYLVKDIQKCSDNGVVACWSDEHNSAIVVMNDLTTELFNGSTIVSIEDSEI